MPSPWQHKVQAWLGASEARLTMIMLYLAALPVAASLAFLTHPLGLLFWTLMWPLGLMQRTFRRTVLLLFIIPALIYIFALLIRPPAAEYFMLLVLVFSAAEQVQADGRPGGFNLIGVVFPALSAMVLSSNIFLFLLLLVSVILYTGILTLRINRMPLAGLRIRLLPIIVALSGSLFFAVAAFVLMPRINPTALPGFNNERSETGLSGSLEITNFSDVLENDEVVFRAMMTERLPDEQLFWRVYSLTEMKGADWEAGNARKMPLNRPFFARATGRDGETISYEIRHVSAAPKYLPILGVPGKIFDNPKLVMNAQGEVLPLNEREVLPRSSKVTSQNTPLYFANNPRFTAVDGQPQLQKWARDLRINSASNVEFASKLMRHFAEGSFAYSLRPPDLTGPPQTRIDDFFFNTKSGYCSHFASSMAIALRAAGVPANVVLGFSGGEWNRYGNYYRVRQSDAHAWVEAEIMPGIWQRFDPTAMVPSAQLVFREQAAANETIEDTSWRGTWRRSVQRLDAFIVQLNNDIILYDEAARRELLSGTFLGSLVSFITFWLFGSLAFAVPLLIVRWWMRRDALQVLDRMFARLARKDGLTRAAHEGRLAFAARWCAVRPSARAAIEQFAQDWCRAFFVGPLDRDRKRHLSALLKSIRAAG